MTAAMTLVLSVTVFANLYLATRSTTAPPAPPEPADHPTGIEFYV